VVPADRLAGPDTAARRGRAPDEWEAGDRSVRPPRHRGVPVAAPPPASSARAIARYLVGLRPILTDACGIRNDWVRRLGLLIQEAHSGDVGRVARGSGALGREFGVLFRNTRSRIHLLGPPAECDVRHASVRA